MNKNPIFNFLVGVAGGIACNSPAIRLQLGLPTDVASDSPAADRRSRGFALSYGSCMALLYLLFRPSAAWEKRLRDQIRSGEEVDRWDIGPWRDQRVQEIADEYGVEFERHPLIG